MANSVAPDPVAPVRRRWWVRALVALAAAVTAFHIFSTFLWIAPASGLRQLYPPGVLQQWMIPMFGQSWSVFAPEPINGDYRLQVRATVVDGGAEETTRWVDATAAEISMIQYDLTPPRAGIQSTELASRLKGAWDELTPGQREVVELGFYKGADWEPRLQQAVLAVGNTPEAREYLEVEHITSAYATQVAYAAFGEEVVAVQFVVSRQNVIPFGQRHDAGAQRPPVQPVPTGFRGPVEEPGQDRENFSRVFRDALEESGQ
ncbi:DUF5819 family protein [Auraticoccus monumenti]|uniref:Uncharacterized protein n=1 Tax=Auraticoccus monumenti TaxID=675864 RepID=A0A1G6U363_9ACTN|nr:DUF5819 family protein [Auraticoccus monumenti]SDD35768.1 hypothetical protein SAMN04489747_0781 [Auraticoccus monumenti]